MEEKEIFTDNELDIIIRSVRSARHTVDNIEPEEAAREHPIYQALNKLEGMYDTEKAHFNVAEHKKKMVDGISKSMRDLITDHDNLLNKLENLKNQKKDENDENSSRANDNRNDAVQSSGDSK